MRLLDYKVQDRELLHLHGFIWNDEADGWLRNRKSYEVAETYEGIWHLYINYGYDFKDGSDREEFLRFEDLPSLLAHQIQSK